MSDNSPSRAGRKTPRPGSVNFGIWKAVIFAGHAIGMAISVGLAGAILSLPARRLLVPYAILLYCGLALSPLLYLARLSRGRPSPVRFDSE